MRSARRFHKSRYGCRECKQSRLKCDEMYPICQRCWRRGLVCHGAARERQWQIQVSSFYSSPNKTTNSKASEYPLNVGEESLIWYWIEKTSRILAPCEEENPFAHPVWEHLSISQSLLHVIKSISSAHQHFFEAAHLYDSLAERTKAMEALRLEIDTGAQPLHALFLSIYLLGISSSYLDGGMGDLGQEHLVAAEVLVDLMLKDRDLRKHPMTRWIVGTFIYWNMSCSFLEIPASNPVEQNNTEILRFILNDMAGYLHPINGPCTELFYIISTLGQYIRFAVEHGTQDDSLDIDLEMSLLNWSLPASDVPPAWVEIAEAFRKYALILLCRYRHLVFKPHVPQEICLVGPDRNIAPIVEDDSLARRYAIEIIKTLSRIPVSSPYLMLQGIPLLTAGAELTYEDSDLRNESKFRLLALYSSSRIPASLAAVSLLESIWQTRMQGGEASWFQTVVDHKCKLRIG
ncbi:fungal-specific transcription factor domain-containing protein [Pyrenochaeta sp. MPI-SDFR-AT-0127]|nr:fungal-specific transcription factor domain-containing protein [Pyrenochaeta sp. MPI-SDFR-AT-0127]